VICWLWANTLPGERMALRRAIGEFLLGQEALRCFIARGPLRRGQKQCSPFWPWRASRLIRGSKSCHGHVPSPQCHGPPRRQRGEARVLIG